MIGRSSRIWTLGKREGSCAHFPLHSDQFLLPRSEGRSGSPDSRLGWDMLGWTGWSPGPWFLQLSCHVCGASGGGRPLSPGPQWASEPREVRRCGQRPSSMVSSWVENQRVWASAAGLTCPGARDLISFQGLGASVCLCPSQQLQLGPRRAV